jgi:adenylate cyclase
MPTEIERKFLVTSDAWRAHVRSSHRVSQGYILSGAGRTVRVRVNDGRGFLTVKGPSDAAGLSRDEWEYEIPREHAQQMIERLCSGGVIDKTRHLVPASGGLTWEIDEFHGDNAGLIVAEIELPSADAAFDKPAWLGREVSAEVRYRNSSLIERPYSAWGRCERG